MVSRSITEYDNYEYPLVGKDTPENREKAEKAKEDAKQLAKELDEKYGK